jgi:hypothetical protein
LGADKQFLAYVKALCHQWSKNGDHIGFNSASKVVQLLQEATIPQTAARASVSRWLAKEVEDFKDGKGFRKRPDMSQLLVELNNENSKRRNSLQEMVVEVDPDESSQSKFPKRLYSKLEVEILALIDQTGFSVDDVAAFASKIYREDAGEAEGSPTWIPSTRWCYYFLHRMGTLHGELPPTPSLHLSNWQIKIGCMLSMLAEWQWSERLDSPENSFLYARKLVSYWGCQWAKTGSKHVASEVKDKRHYSQRCVSLSHYLLL